MNLYFFFFVFVGLVKQQRVSHSKGNNILMEWKSIEKETVKISFKYFHFSETRKECIKQMKIKNEREFFFYSSFFFSTFLASFISFSIWLFMSLSLFCMYDGKIKTTEIKNEWKSWKFISVFHLPFMNVPIAVLVERKWYVILYFDRIYFSLSVVYVPMYYLYVQLAIFGFLLMR